jgi:hypothetical protein
MLPSVMCDLRRPAAASTVRARRGRRDRLRDGTTRSTAREGAMPQIPDPRTTSLPSARRTTTLPVNFPYPPEHAAVIQASSPPSCAKAAIPSLTTTSVRAAPVATPACCSPTPAFASRLWPSPADAGTAAKTASAGAMTCLARMFSSPPSLRRRGRRARRGSSPLRAARLGSWAEGRRPLPAATIRPA